MRLTLLALLLLGCSTTAPGDDTISDLDGDGIPDTEDTDADGNGIPDDEQNDVGEPTVDDDGDGFSEVDGDCNDKDPNISPTASDLVGDDIDQNCDGMDGTDVDQDGFASSISGGLDCDDIDPNINPDQEDTWYDGVDTDCDGLSDFDQDGDGFDQGADDCDDLRTDVNIEHDEWAEDGLDNDCDGTADEFRLTFTEWDESAIGGVVIEIDGGDPNGFELGMAAPYYTPPGPFDLTEDCLIGICHVLGYVGGSLDIINPFADTVAPNVTAWAGGAQDQLTFVLRFNSTGTCYTWGVAPEYYTAEGCLEIDPTI